MPGPLNHPFVLESAFFLRTLFQRATEVPDPLNTTFSINLRLADRPDKKLEIQLRAATDGDQPVTFELDLVGIFNLAPEQDYPDREATLQFIQDQGFTALWPRITQAVLVATAQMGMKPITLPTPQIIDLRETESGEEKDATE